MPPKKAQAAAESQADAAADSIGANGIEAWELPKSLVTKIAKSAVGDTGAPAAAAFGNKAEPPMPTKFTKDATLSMVKGSTVFINYVGEQVVLFYSFLLLIRYCLLCDTAAT
jgi:DNA polymerase epsilon subunit 3